MIPDQVLLVKFPLRDLPLHPRHARLRDPGAVHIGVAVALVGERFRLLLELLARDTAVPGLPRFSGYFDDFERLATAAAQIRGAQGVYITLNGGRDSLSCRWLDPRRYP